MSRVLPRFILPTLTLLVLSFFAVEAKATLTGICQPDAPAQCDASVSISGNVLTITLTNTSPVLNGGFITATAFNLTAGTSITNFSTSNANFALFGPGGGVWSGSVSPDGSRTSLISATGNDYNGGGSPSGGVGIGSSVVLTVTFASLNGNTEQSIFNSILVRSRGFEDDGSDKDGLIPVPEPMSLLLLGSGLAGTAGVLRNRRNKRRKTSTES